MTEINKVYLELSEDEGVSHKFFEVIVIGCEMTTRYGRIGSNGQRLIKKLDTPEKANIEAKKKIKAKQKKGYAEAIQGVRKARAITRRTIDSNRSSSKDAPILWKFQSGADAFGIFVDNQSCWIGNENGSIYKLNHKGEVQRQFRLKNGVKAIVSDECWLYAGCDDGSVYDLTGKMPRVAYDIHEDVDIYWIDIYDGILGVSDANGNVLITNYEDESISKCKSKGSSGWMIRCDEDYVYHGHTKGITVYDSLGNSNIWKCKTHGEILFGWQEKHMLYVGTTKNRVQAISKKGKIEQNYLCDASVFSCATSKNGEYIFAGDNYSSIYCFHKSGERIWKLGSTCGSAYSMQYLDERLYIVTTEGTMACIDASEEAINNVNVGTYPVTKNIKAPASIEITMTTKLEITTDVSHGVIVECYKKGEKLRVRVISEGYNKEWNVQFPKNIRQEGMLYIVEDIKASNKRGFYRVYGDIKKLES